MRRRLPITLGLAVAVAVVLGGAGARADSSPDAVKAPPLKVPFERFQLPNGLTVILHEDHRAPRVVVDTWYSVGSKDEKVGRTGFAHLFEHLMFMGTQAVPNGQFDTIMEAEGGSNNATTSEDRTNYYDVGPSHLLETFLWLEADRLSTLADGMTKEKVDLQRDVVKNERRQSYENRPYGKVELVLSEHLYPPEHPYHHPVIGSHEDLTAATVDDVKDFFRTWYVPSNASLVIAGDFSPAEARKLVEKYFGWMPKRPEPVHAKPAPGKLTKSDKVVITDAVQLEQVTLAYHSAPSFAPGDAASDVLATALGGGKSSRLYRALVYDKKLAQAVRVEQHSQRYGSFFTIMATATPGHTAAELESAIDVELTALLGARPLQKDEVDRSRAIAQTQLLRGLEKTFGMADALNLFEFYYKDPAQLAAQALPRYDAVSVASTMSEAHAVLGAPRVVVHVLPAAKGGKR